MLSGPLQNRLHGAFALGTIGLLAGCPEKRAPAEGAPVVLSASAAVGSAPPTPSLRSVSEVCATICEPSHVLKCNNAEQCLAHCVAAGTGTPCSSEFQGFYRCLVGQPISNWECAEDGIAAIKPPLCDAEQERAVRCMEAKAVP